MKGTLIVPTLIALLVAEASAAEVRKLPLTKPDPAWTRSLYDKGTRKLYTGKELETIGMPCGGVASGQLYVRGDGTLACWMIFNNVRNTGFGDRCYRTYRPESPLIQGASITVKSGDAPALVRKLDQTGFDAIEFVGEYPIAEIRYRSKDGLALPVQVNAEVFSPFIPLNARDSGMPVTIFRYTVRNTSNAPLTVELLSALQNGVCHELDGVPNVLSRNRIVSESELSGVQMDIVEVQPTTAPADARRTIVFEDFEAGNYNNWKIEGNCFGKAPATGTLPNQQPVGGWHGKLFVNTYVGGDGPQGTATSQSFKIPERFIAFLIGGGSHAGRTCLNLLVNGKVLRTATGQDNEALRLRSWDVSDLQGKDAQLQIVDKESGPWGHINVDYIHFTNLRPDIPDKIPANHPGRGDMSIIAVDPKGGADSVIRSIDEPWSKIDASVTAALGTRTLGRARSEARIEPNQSHTFTFLVAWYFPNRPNVGNMYANWFKDSLDVARHVSKNIDRLYAQTRLFRDTYFDTTLPYWLAQRLGMPVSTLATETCQWWKNGRFYAWEGVGCCEGTCTHVWNYDHAGARLFPELERSTRTMQDFGVAFDQKTGLVGFRGNRAYAADGQCGTILKAYREHLMSPDRKFLDSIWPRVKAAMEFMIRHDGNEDGIIEDSQHNTYDINFEGANTFVGSLYLAALRAAEEMARIEGDSALADRYHRIFEKGSACSVDKLFNGEYFFQIIPPGKPDRHQYGTGCLADQVFGQGWAHQVGLGYIYPQDKVKTALASVFKHCWTTDVGPYNKLYPPQRWFARPGEAGLFTASWPRGGRPAEPVLYRDEIWTGIEYQVAGNMIFEGMLDEGLSIIRGAHDRYDGARHNPWNEVECGDHYARAMASWGCLLALEGFIYDGPAGTIGFAPRITPDNFKSFFTAAEGWGSLIQHRGNGAQHNSFDLKWGSLRVSRIVIQAIPSKKATLAVSGQSRALTSEVKDGLLIITPAEPITITAGQTIDVAQLP